MQKSETSVRSTLEKLVETGFLEPHGTGRGRTYTLSVKLYQNAGQNAEYIRQASFSTIQQEQMVLNYIETHGSIKRSYAAELCQISPYQATRLLKKLKEKELIRSVGKSKGTRYECR